MTRNSIFTRLSSLMGLMVMLSSCSSEDAGSQSGRTNDNIVHLTSRIQATRSTNDLQTNQISNGVEVGVYGLSGGNTIANGDNARYIADGSGNLQASSSTMLWPESSSLTVYAYAPYQEGWNYAATAKTFTVAADQSTDEGYLQSDLIYAKATANSQSTISLSFTHQTARLIITMNTGTELSAATVRVVNTKPSATLDMTDGCLGDATGETTPIIIGSNIHLDANGTMTLYAAIIPQDILANTTLIEVTDGNDTWKFNFSDDKQFEGGYSYSLTVTAGMSTMTSSTNGTATTPALSPKK